MTLHTLGISTLALLMAGCIQEESAPAAVDAQIDAARPTDGAADARVDGAVPDAAREPDAAPGPDGPIGPGDADGDGICDFRKAFDDALAAYGALADSYTCRTNDDCAEVELCPGEFCDYGTPLNDATAAAIDARFDPDARCEDCGPGVDPFCPEPEPPPIGCEQGICTFGGQFEPRTPPDDCEEAIDSLEAALDIIAERARQRCDVDADCAVLTASNTCTGPTCAVLPMRADSLPAAQARLEAHLRFNRCDLCGLAPTECDGYVAGCRDGYCEVVDR